MSDISSDKGTLELTPANFILQVCSCIDNEALVIGTEIDRAVRVGSRDRQVLDFCSCIITSINFNLFKIVDI